MIGKSKEFEDVGKVASSFPTYLGKIEENSASRVTAALIALTML